MSIPMPFLVATSLLFTLLSLCEVSRSEIVSYEFTGVVSRVDPLLVTEFSLGESVVGYFSYDTTTPATISPNTSGAIFFEATTDFEVLFGDDYLVTKGPLSNDAAFNNIGSNTNDTFLTAFEYPNAPTVAGLDPLVLIMGFIDTDSNVFDSLPSDTLPSVLPDISQFESILTSLIFDDAPVNRWINFDILTLNRIPEPQSVLLISIASLISLGRRVN